MANHAEKRAKEKFSNLCIWPVVSMIRSYDDNTEYYMQNYYINDTIKFTYEITKGNNYELLLVIDGYAGIDKGPVEQLSPLKFSAYASEDIKLKYNYPLGYSKIELNSTIIGITATGLDEMYRLIQKLNAVCDIIESVIDLYNTGDIEKQTAYVKNSINNYNIFTGNPIITYEKILISRYIEFDNKYIIGDVKLFNKKYNSNTEEVPNINVCIDFKSDINIFMASPGGGSLKEMDNIFKTFTMEISYFKYMEEFKNNCRMVLDDLYEKVVDIEKQTAKPLY